MAYSYVSTCTHCTRAATAVIDSNAVTPVIPLTSHITEMKFTVSGYYVQVTSEKEDEDTYFTLVGLLVEGNGGTQLTPMPFMDQGPYMHFFFPRRRATFGSCPSFHTPSHALVDKLAYNNVTSPKVGYNTPVIVVKKEFVTSLVK